MELCPTSTYATAFQLLVAPLCDRRCFAPHHFLTRNLLGLQVQPRRRRWSHGSPSPMLHSAHPSRLFLGRGRRHLLCHLEHHQGGRWQCPWLRLVQRTILSQISFPLWCPAPLRVLHPRDGKKRVRGTKQLINWKSHRRRPCPLECRPLLVARLVPSAGA